MLSKEDLLVCAFCKNLVSVVRGAMLPKFCKSLFIWFCTTCWELFNLICQNKLLLASLAFVRKFRSQLLSAWLTPF
jgi:cell division protein FtsB